MKGEKSPEGDVQSAFTKWVASGAATLPKLTIYIHI